MKIKFWGVRGSIPTPWKDAMQVGGNTSCVQIIPREEQLIILDAGTGLRILGDSLVGKPVQGHLLLSHMHWDHIQGFPFFVPAYIPGNQFTLYGTHWSDQTLEQIMSGQMRAPYFPVELNQMAADLKFVELKEETFWIDDVKITARKFNHPGGVLGFRIEQDEQVIIFATDMEYTEHNLDPGLIDFAKDADILIYDAQYTPEELANKTGWGHSTHIAAAHLAKTSNVKNLMLYHHDPSHSDQMLQRMLSEARQIFDRSYLATEDLLIDLSNMSANLP